MHSSGGFTLIEITLVMAITGLLFAIALPNMGALSESLAYRGAVRDVMSAAQSARRQSARTGEPVDLLIYPELKALEVSSGRTGLQELPRSISLAVTSAAEVSPGPDVAAIRFYPFGGSTGGDIEIGGPSGGGDFGGTSDSGGDPGWGDPESGGGPVDGDLDDEIPF